MIDPRARLAAAALAGLLGLGIACTQSYLYDERRRDQLPTDRTITLEGRFCTLGTNDVVRPIKILFAFDASQSMRVSDPNGTRALAVVQLLNSLPRDPNIDFSVMLFAGSTTAFLTKSGLPQFEPLLSYTPADFTTLSGIPGQWDHPKIWDAYKKIAKAAEKAGKWWGTPAFSPEHCRKLMDLGALFFCHSADIVIFKTGLEGIQKQFAPLGFTFDNQLAAGRSYLEG